MTFRLENATEKDLPQILTLIKELSEYEKPTDLAP